MSVCRFSFAMSLNALVILSNAVVAQKIAFVLLYRCMHTQTKYSFVGKTNFLTCRQFRTSYRSRSTRSKLRVTHDVFPLFYGKAPLSKLLVFCMNHVRISLRSIMRTSECWWAAFLVVSIICCRSFFFR